METPEQSPSLGLASPASTGVSWHSLLGQHLSWLILALGGTVEIKAETKGLRQETMKLKLENERRDGIYWQRKSENAQLAGLESKINLLFPKHGINSNSVNKPKQP